MKCGAPKKTPPKYKWWQGMLFYAVVTAIGYLSVGKRKQSKELYEKQDKQAPWAPPSWLFGPAWSLNNLFLVWGLLRILNNPNLSQRNKLLVEQTLMWVIFSTFGIVYFRKKSPVLAEAWTQADALLATSSLITALKQDKKLALAYAPFTIWTWYASTVSAWQALKNPDPLLGTKALLK